MPTSWVDLHTRIETLSIQNRNILHQIQQRKNQKVIIGYKYKVKCNLNSESKQKGGMAEEKETTDERKPWQIIPIPKTSNVNPVLDGWKYEGLDLEHDGLLLDSYIDLDLKTFTDLERLVDITSNIGDKYIRFFNEESKETLKAFDIMSGNLQKLRDSLDDLSKSTTDMVEDIASNNDVRQNMDQMMMSYTKVCEKFPESYNVKEENQNLVINFELKIKDNDIPTLVDIGDIRKLRCAQTLNPHKNSVWDIKIYEIDGDKFVASGGEDKNIKLQRLSDKSLVATLTGHTNDVYSLVSYKNADGKQCLASSSHDGSVRLWDLHENQCIATLSNQSNSSAFGLATFKKDDRHLIACGYYNGDIKIWDLQSQTEVETLKGHGNERYLRALLVFEKDDEKFLVSGSNDATIKVWDLEKYTLVKSIEQANFNSVLCMASFDLEGKTYLAGGYKDVKVWDTEDFSLVSTFTGHTSYVHSLKVCEYNNGSVALVSASDDHTVKFWDVSNKQLLHTLNCGHGVCSLDIYENEDYKACLVTGGGDGSLKFWME